MKYRIVKAGSVIKEFDTDNVAVSLANLFLNGTIRNAEKCVVQEQVGNDWVDKITLGKHLEEEVPSEDGEPWSLEDILAREG